jgi:hypothetical protein
MRPRAIAETSPGCTSGEIAVEIIRLRQAHLMSEPKIS